MPIYLKDLAERVASTFVVTFLGLLVSSGWFSVDQITDVSILERAGIAGLAAVLSLIKGWVAMFVGDSSSASLAPSVAVVERRPAG